MFDGLTKELSERESQMSDGLTKGLSVGRVTDVGWTDKGTEYTKSDRCRMV